MQNLWSSLNDDCSSSMGQDINGLLKEKKWKQLNQTEKVLNSVKKDF